jgi:hypothetical protein
MILVEIDHLETIEVHDIPETIEVHEILEILLDQIGGVRKF